MLLDFVFINGGALVSDLALFCKGARGANFPRVELAELELVVFETFTGSGRPFFAAKFGLFEMLLLTVRLLFVLLFEVENGLELRELGPGLLAAENPDGAVRLKVSLVVAAEPDLNSFFFSFSIRAEKKKNNVLKLNLYKIL